MPRFYANTWLIILGTLLIPSPGICEEAPNRTPQLIAGSYHLDQAHTSVTFSLNHLGFSNFTGRFDRVQGSLNFDPTKLEASELNITLDTKSIDTNVAALDEDLGGQNWFDTIKYPHATFHATHIERTGANTAVISGDLTLHGITHILKLDTVLVGAGKDIVTGDQVMGFSATGHLQRSDYGISNLLPMIGNDVTLHIECEFDSDKSN